MSTAWIKENKPKFVRDVLRDFCLSGQALERQFRHFDEHGMVHFEVLRDLLGQEHNKGLLWRLKDTAHHLFRNESGQKSVGQFLDWGMGYIFHETIKLKEDCYQQQAYAPWFRDMQSASLPPDEAVICQELYQVVLQTKQSMQREISRIRFILFHMRRLFPRYLEGHGDNTLLARFLLEEEELLREVLGSNFEELLDSLYAGSLEEMYLLASQSYRLGGWMTEAGKATDRAVRIGPQSPRVLQEKEIVDNWRKKFNI